MSPWVSDKLIGRPLRNELATHLLNLCRIYSPSGYERGVIDYCVPLLQQNGFEVTVDDIGNIIATRGKTESGKYIMVNAHMDTVQRQDDAIMMTDPNFVYYDRFWNIIAGHNVMVGGDDKCGCAIAMTLATSTTLSFKILLTVGEEAGCYGVEAVDKKVFDDVLFCFTADRKHCCDIIDHYCGRTCAPDTVTKEISAVAREHNIFMEKNSGSVADTYHICQYVPAVNLSSGYYNAHTSFDFIRVGETHDTMMVIRQFILNPGRMAAAIAAAPKNWQKGTTYGTCYTGTWVGYDEYRTYDYGYKDTYYNKSYGGKKAKKHKTYTYGVYSIADAMFLALLYARDVLKLTDPAARFTFPPGTRWRLRDHYLLRETDSRMEGNKRIVTIELPVDRRDLANVEKISKSKPAVELIEKYGGISTITEAVWDRILETEDVKRLSLDYKGDSIEECESKAEEEEVTKKPKIYEKCSIAAEDVETKLAEPRRYGYQDVMWAESYNRTWEDIVDAGRPKYQPTTWGQKSGGIVFADYTTPDFPPALALTPSQVEDLANLLIVIIDKYPTVKIGIKTKSGTVVQSIATIRGTDILAGALAEIKVVKEETGEDFIDIAIYPDATSLQDLEYIYSSIPEVHDVIEKLGKTYKEYDEGVKTVIENYGRGVTYGPEYGKSKHIMERLGGLTVIFRSDTNDFFTPLVASVTYDPKAGNVIGHISVTKHNETEELEKYNIYSNLESFFILLNIFAYRVDAEIERDLRDLIKDTIDEAAEGPKYREYGRASTQATLIPEKKRKIKGYDADKVITDIYSLDDSAISEIKELVGDERLADDEMFIFVDALYDLALQTPTEVYGYSGGTTMPIGEVRFTVSGITDDVRFRSHPGEVGVLDNIAQIEFIPTIGIDAVAQVYHLSRTFGAVITAYRWAYATELDLVDNPLEELIETIAERLFGSKPAWAEEDEGEEEETGKKKKGKKGKKGKKKGKRKYDDYVISSETLRDMVKYIGYMGILKTSDDELKEVVRSMSTISPFGMKIKKNRIRVMVNEPAMFANFAFSKVTFTPERKGSTIEPMMLDSNIKSLVFIYNLARAIPNTSHQDIVTLKYKWLEHLAEAIRGEIADYNMFGESRGASRAPSTPWEKDKTPRPTPIPRPEKKEKVRTDDLVFAGFTVKEIDEIIDAIDSLDEWIEMTDGTYRMVQPTEDKEIQYMEGTVLGTIIIVDAYGNPINVEPISLTKQSIDNFLGITAGAIDPPKAISDLYWYYIGRHEGREMGQQYKEKKKKKRYADIPKKDFTPVTQKYITDGILEELVRRGDWKERDISSLGNDSIDFEMARTDENTAKGDIVYIKLKFPSFGFQQSPHRGTFVVQGIYKRGFIGGKDVWSLHIKGKPVTHEKEEPGEPVKSTTTEQVDSTYRYDDQVDKDYNKRKRRGATETEDH